MKYLGMTGLTYLCNKVTSALKKLENKITTHTSAAASTTAAGHVKFGTTAGTACQGNDSRLVDTKDTAGSTESNQKIYLIGAPTQASSAKTYSNSSLYYDNYALHTSELVVDNMITPGSSGIQVGSPDKIFDSVYAFAINGDTADSTVTFTSSDNLNPTAWTDAELLKSGETHKSLLQKVSVMFKNMRYLKKSVNELENNQFKGWCDTYSGYEATLPSSSQTLTTIIQNWCGSAGVYAMEAYIMMSDPSFTGTISMSMSHGDNYDYVYDSRYISGMAPTMRIFAMMDLKDSNEFIISAGQVNNLGKSYKAKAYLKCWQLS